MSIVVKSTSIFSHSATHSIATLAGMDSGNPHHSQIYSQDLYLHVKTWPVPRDVEFQGKILFLHSIGDNKDTYSHIWPVIQNEGFEVVAYDARGFGSTSPGKLSGISNELLTYLDLDKMIESVTEKYTGALFLAGVSMGGAIVLNYMIKGKYKARINGYLSIAPLVLLHPKTDQGTLVRIALPYLSKFMPNFTASGKVKEKYMTTDPDRVKIIKDNPRALKVSAPLVTGMLDRGKKLLENDYINQSIDRPMVVFHGTNDFVNSYKATENYFTKLKCVTDKKMFSYHNYFHDLLQETPERIEKVLEDVKFWLADHTPEPETRVNSIETIPKGFF